MLQNPDSLISKAYEFGKPNKAKKTGRASPSNINNLSMAAGEKKKSPKKKKKEVVPESGDARIQTMTSVYKSLIGAKTSQREDKKKPKQKRLPIVNLREKTIEDDDEYEDDKDFKKPGDNTITSIAEEIAEKP